METEWFRRGLDFLPDEGVDVECVVTDKTKVWALMKKWESLPNHIGNIHVFPGNVKFKKSEHPHLIDREWLKPGTKPHNALRSDWTVQPQPAMSKDGLNHTHGADSIVFRDGRMPTTTACSSSCSSVCDCNNKGLTSVPQDLPTNITRLDLQGNKSPGHTVDLEGVRILDTEQDYFKRGIKEAIYISALQPSLNRDGGRYRLQTTFDPLLTSHVGKITCPQHLGQIAEED
ncbi:hypothetical protein Bbelb_018640 [Branchiostoma belcheri]|nr:hypothetical protein Bbelb_018640 [Branchiostoma belcheri]